MKIPKFIDNKLRKHYYESFVKQEHRTVLEFTPAENVCFKNRMFLPTNDYKRYLENEEFRKDILCEQFRDVLPQIVKTTSVKQSFNREYMLLNGYEIEVELRGFKY